MYAQKPRHVWSIRRCSPTTEDYTWAPPHDAPEDLKEETTRQRSYYRSKAARAAQYAACHPESDGTVTGCLSSTSYTRKLLSKLSFATLAQRRAVANTHHIPINHITCTQPPRARIQRSSAHHRNMTVGYSVAALNKKRANRPRVLHNPHHGHAWSACALCLSHIRNQEGSCRALRGS